MRFGLAAACRTADGPEDRRFDLDGFVAECAAAEAAGFVAAYTGERHLGDRRSTSSPLLACALALAGTRRLVLGTALLVLPIHHPVRVAEEAALLDSTFRGRLRLGVGAGYMPGDFEPFGVDLADRTGAMRSGLAAIDAFRRGEEAELAGPWTGRVPARDAALGADRTEVFLGAWSRPGVRMAAQLADGWITDPIRNVRWLEDLAGVYRDECARVGKTPRVVLFRDSFLDLGDRPVATAIGDALLHDYRTYVEVGNAFSPRWDPWLTDLGGPADLTPDHIVADRMLWGSAADWIEQLAAWEAVLAPEEIIVRTRHVTGPPLDHTLRTIEEIGRSVLPAWPTAIEEGLR